MNKVAVGHNVTSIVVKPTAATNMEEYFLATNGKVVEHAFTGKAIRAQVTSVIGSLFIFVKINMDGGLRGHLQKRVA